jgi:hypothetical protein
MPTRTAAARQHFPAERHPGSPLSIIGGPRRAADAHVGRAADYACAGDQFLAGTKNIWWLSFCVDPLPVAGQVVLMLESLARLSGRFLSLYTCPMLCFSTGPSFKITETAMSCVPPHLLQRAKILYLVVGGIASSFSRMVVL